MSRPTQHTEGDGQSLSGVRQRRILHCDMDCFYAAVHMRDDPALRGRPVVVGGDPQSRGVVAAASYEARRFGIHSAMAAAHAARLCPDAVFLRTDFERYRSESAAIFAIYREFTPQIQTLSLDEAYLDVSDHLEGYGSASAVARAIRARVSAERNLTVSVGVGPNKLIAKIASDHDKPDGLTVVSPARVEAFLAPLGVRKLMGVGPAAERRLLALGIRTIADLRRVGLDELVRTMGRWGGMLWEYSWGRDERPVADRGRRKSLGAERTYPEDLAELELMHREIDRLAERVSASLERRELRPRTVTLKVRYADFETVTRSRSPGSAIHESGELAAVARQLLAKTEAGVRTVRLLGISTSRFEDDEERDPQLDLWSRDSDS